MHVKEQSDFPLWWLDDSKRNIEGLRTIADHLHEKTVAFRYACQGFKGPVEPMDAQLIMALNRLESHVSILSDVVESTLQIIVEEHKGKRNRIGRSWAWIKATAHKWEQAIVQNWFYRIVAIASTLAFLVGIWLAVRHIRW
jgi:hypothetical protein